MRGTIGPTLNDNEVPFSVMRDGDIRGGGTIGSTFSDNKSSFSVLRGRDIRGGGCIRVDTQRTIELPIFMMRGGDLRVLLTGSTLGS